MAPTRKLFHNAVSESSAPPTDLAADQCIARLVKAVGNRAYICQLPRGQIERPDVADDKGQVLVELEPQFKDVVYVRRGIYVVVQLEEPEETTTKKDKTAQKHDPLVGSIKTVIMDEKRWREQPYWPAAFVKKPVHDSDDDSDEEESRVGQMPSSDEE